MRSQALTNQTQIQPKKADQIAFTKAPGANEKQQQIARISAGRSHLIRFFKCILNLLSNQLATHHAPRLITKSRDCHDQPDSN